MSEQRGSSPDADYETTCYAHFEHDDGSWYLLWITHSQPRSARGHPWHVHVSFDKYGGTQPVASSSGWSMGPYGMHNWDFDSEAAALEDFNRRYQARIDHGYRVVRAQLPSQKER